MDLFAAIRGAYRPRHQEGKTIEDDHVSYGVLELAA
jgi:hypothetical protein